MGRVNSRTRKLFVGGQKKNVKFDSEVMLKLQINSNQKLRGKIFVLIWTIYSVVRNLHLLESCVCSLIS